MPLSLVEQLKPGGRLFIPVGTDSQDVWTVDKTLEGEIKSERLFR
jgi:protein-L-isoaspartate(D-aspartate) O-methyltransferase